MASLKELRTRIESIKNTSKITAAMKMVSASKFRRAQITLERAEYYHQLLESNIKKVLVDLKIQEKEKGIKFILPRMLVHTKNPKIYALFVLTSDKGLCGNYNLTIAKEAKRRIEELKSQGKEVIVFCYGKQGYLALKRLGIEDIEGHYPNVIKRHLTYPEALHFLHDVWVQKLHHKADVCEIVYSDFLSGLTRELICKQVIPFDIELTPEDYNLNKVGDAYYEFIPDKLELLKEISSVYMRANIFEVLINSQASEHVARMSSMDNANKNAQDMISSLTFKYNSLRQSAITTELVEIVAGSEAM